MLYPGQGCGGSGAHVETLGLRQEHNPDGMSVHHITSVLILRQVKKKKKVVVWVKHYRGCQLLKIVLEQTVHFIEMCRSSPECELCLFK